MASGAGSRSQKDRSWKNTPLALSVRSANLLVSWGVPLILLHLCDSIAQEVPRSENRRDLAVVDAFCGQAEITRAFRDVGAKVGYFDLELMGEEGDILSMTGFRNMVKMILRLRVGGLLIGGPPCGSWVWINSATHQRRKFRIFGNTKLDYVKAANTITCRFILLGLLAISRAAFFAGEQPGSSIMLSYPYMIYMATILQQLYWDKVRFPMGAYGHPSTKPTILFGTLPYLQKFHRKLTNKDKRRIAKNKAIKKFQTVRKTVSKSGKVQVTGSYGLKRSAAYPPGFARFLVKTHLNSLANTKHLEKKYIPSPADPARQAPFNWRHAGLAEIKHSLQRKACDGSYTPILRSGLHD
ncbi:Putative rhamnose biosynthetic enzyme 1 [Durusdinium trenchii]|uniref:Rhamnose biosynthetic enzyme 1 n=1 Tax=Durusdinium trenchii TaxID=1381693 RepID=A0ABP0L4D1_9DINO